MKKYLFIPLFVACVSTTAYAQTFHYRLFHEASGQTLEVSTVRFEQSAETVKLTFEEGVDAPTKFEEYLFNKNYETLTWRVRNDAQGTDYAGKRLGNVLHLEGRFQGKAVNKDLKIDEAPFLAFPKYELRPHWLKLRKEPFFDFWAIRSDTLEVYRMVANFKGEETISVNGKEIKAWKVYWSAANPLFRFFKRTYYYRQPDGIFLKQEFTDGTVRELIKEE